MENSKNCLQAVWSPLALFRRVPARGTLFFFFFLIKLSFSFQLDHQFRRNQQEILNQKNRITNKPGGTALDFTLKAAAFRLKVDCIKIKLVRAKDPRRDVIL